MTCIVKGCARDTDLEYEVCDECCAFLTSGVFNGSCASTLYFDSLNKSIQELSAKVEAHPWVDSISPFDKSDRLFARLLEEAGEFASAAKHYWKGPDASQEAPDLRERVKQEAGDLLLVVLRLFQFYMIPISTTLQDTITRLDQRTPK